MRLFAVAPEVRYEQNIDGVGNTQHEIREVLIPKVRRLLHEFRSAWRGDSPSVMRGSAVKLKLQFDKGGMVQPKAKNWRQSARRGSFGSETEIIALQSRRSTVSMSVTESGW